jgi:hypothetical protein
MGPAWRIIQPYNVALAPQINSPEPLWYVGCKVMSGEDKICESPFSLVVPTGDNGPKANYPQSTRRATSKPTMRSSQDGQNRSRMLPWRVLLPLARTATLQARLGMAPFGRAYRQSLKTKSAKHSIPHAACHLAPAMRGSCCGPTAIFHGSFTAITAHWIGY